MFALVRSFVRSFVHLSGFHSLFRYDRILVDGEGIKNQFLVVSDPLGKTTPVPHLSFSPTRRPSANLFITNSFAVVVGRTHSIVSPGPRRPSGKSVIIPPGDSD